MLNRNIYVMEPSTQKLKNEGVANVNDEQTEKELEVLRYELETFVCDGQYEKGMQDILDTYLSNIEQPQQPAVWISGFYGSGKSHLVKMLRSLWMDVEFADGATARGVAELPQNIKDQFKELSVQAKRHGGLHAASGTLGAGASGSVRLALMRIIFKSVGLPESYPIAKFVMWLKQEEIFDAVKSHVESNGFDWDEELDNFYVAEGLHEALAAVKPNIFSSADVCLETLTHLYPHVNDISNEQMLKAVKQALTKDDKFPLTLIVLDEVQQYIANGDKSIEVQEVVESIVKSIGGKLMFIGTGQTAVTGTPNLQKLQGRFTVRVELSDTDVDAVIRKVILAKKPEAKDAITETMEKNLGEISRHLQGTQLEHRQDDIQFFTQDYPILPVRRRFWENTLRVLDQTGTDSQLRNQLSMIHKVIQTNADEQLGNVIPADYLYFDSADKLLQARVLPRKVHEATMKWYRAGSEDEKLMARAVGLVFLINKLNDRNKEIGIVADVDTIADLLVDDLTIGSSALRGKLPSLLNGCALLMRVGSEYRIQTEESAAWNDEYENQRGLLANESYRIETEREDRIRKRFLSKFKKRNIIQGESKVSREISPSFDANLPNDADKRVYVWVRNGWVTDVNSVQADARQAGSSSPTIFVFIPSRSVDDLRNQLIYAKAANATMEKMGVPNTPEGKEAYAAMETTKNSAEARVNELLDEALAGIRMFQGGGTEISGIEIDEMVTEAAGNSLSRLYGRFDIADHAGWAKVFAQAAKGSPDALKAVGHDGEVDKHPVCREITRFIGGGKTGAQLRTKFEGEEYGWSGDAVDGALYTLLVAGIIRVESDKKKPLTSKELERKAIGKCSFYLEKATVSAPQKIKIKKLFQLVDVACPSDQYDAYSRDFIDAMQTLAAKAGGEAPRPAVPDTKILDEIRMTPAGNEQLLTIFNYKDELEQKVAEWKEQADKISERIYDWQTLTKLRDKAVGLTDADVLAAQVLAIEERRLLIDTPDPMQPLIKSYTDLLREELNKVQQSWVNEWEQGNNQLDEDESYSKLDQEEMWALREKCQLTEKYQPTIEVNDTTAVLNSLSSTSIEALKDKVAALPNRFQDVQLRAAKHLEPKAQEVRLPRKTIKSVEEIDAWLAEAKAELTKALEQGPVVIG